MAEQDRRIAEDLASREPNAACFHAQQSAEKAITAALVAVADDVPRNHVVTALLDELEATKVQLEPAVVDAARVLDRYYAPTRYPDALGGVDPSRMFVERDAREALMLLAAILPFADAVIAAERRTTDAER